MEFNVLDIVGKSFGELFVEKYTGDKQWKSRKAYFYCCKCVCGKQTTANRTNLLTGHTKSCGCLKQKKGENNKDWKGCGQISGKYWSSVKNKAHRKSRTLQFTITIDEAWQKFESQKRLCALTGIFLEMSCGKRTASLDRIDSNLGYVTDNVQWVHKDINQMKWTLSQDRFIELCECVVRHHSVVA